jgi:hypothetical protein
MSGSIRGKTPRKKGKTPKSDKTSLDNYMKLAYNILKNHEDDIVRDKEIPKLDQCSECNNEVLTHPPKAFSVLSCGHIFTEYALRKSFY